MENFKLTIQLIGIVTALSMVIWHELRLARLEAGLKSSQDKTDGK